MMNIPSETKTRWAAMAGEDEERAEEESGGPRQRQVGAHYLGIWTRDLDDRPRSRRDLGC